MVRQQEKSLLEVSGRIAVEQFQPRTGTIRGAIGSWFFRSVIRLTRLTRHSLAVDFSQFRRIAILLCFVSSSLLLGCEKSTPFEWRQTLWITVETPSGPVTASADQLVAAKFYSRPPLGTSTQVTRNHRGDPVFLDLGGGDVLFAVQTAYLGEMLFLDIGSRFQQFKAFTADPPLDPRPVDLSVDRVARQLHFFRFADLADPSSVEWVDPDDLAASFGPGFALTSIEFSIVAAEISPAIGRVPEALSGEIDVLLPWLSDHAGALRLTRPGQSDLMISPLGLRAGIER